MTSDLIQCREDREAVCHSVAAGKVLQYNHEVPVLPCIGNLAAYLCRKMKTTMTKKQREDHTPVPESFKHYVNMRNRSRIPSAAGGRIYFGSEAQQLRFDKAWMLLWKILSEQMMAWGD